MSSSSSPTPSRSFSSSIPPPTGACHRSWIPSLCSLLCSMGIIWAARYKMDVEEHLEKMLERKKEDGKLLGKCAEELKKKGVEFDLLKKVVGCFSGKKGGMRGLGGEGETPVELPHLVSLACCTLLPPCFGAALLSFPFAATCAAFFSFAASCAAFTPQLQQRWMR
ncbi:hypothetical protein SLEP1_g58454 [Rubroshorea leprosula]|uniref:Uncharacterized protein n=1 Tax=Rubroshorea leprosula TaxID=152421 RepID=A0AAV5MPS0_9ROSI|nr:hypothetical protein SLEP1_g58454 [Rubroshorea leprosula]